MMLSAIPPVLVAVASVLVDVTFRPDQYQDRIRCQIILWLAASLQSTASSKEVVSWLFIQAVFFLSLLSAAYRAWDLRYRWSQAQSQHHNQYDVSRFFAPSALGPLLYSLQQESSTAKSSNFFKECSALFFICFEFLWLLQWHMNRMKRVRQGSLGMPIVRNGNSNADGSLIIDKSTWFDWTPTQVLNWIASLDDSDTNNVDWNTVCSTLSPERIPGSVLDSLTVADLRSMGLLYGPACCLEDCIRDLTIRCSTRHNLRHSHTHAYEPHRRSDPLYASNEWTDNSNFQSDKAVTLQSHPPKSFMEDASREIDKDAARRAQDLMKERFGLELPSMRTNDVDETANNEDSTDTEANRNEPLRAPTISNEHSSPLEGIPPSLLQAMPANIRDVVSRRPDLVKTLMAARTSRAVAIVPPTPTSTGDRDTSQRNHRISRVQQLRMQDPSYAERFVGAQAAAEIEGIPVAIPIPVDENEPAEHKNKEEDTEEGTFLLKKRPSRLSS